MAFNFFKKNTTADLILRNGRVLTQCADLPQAEAVACKDGKIIAVGDSDDIDALAGSDTTVIDLEGKYAVPGFISLWEEPVLAAFEGKYLRLDTCSSKEEILEQMRAWQTFHAQEEILFGYGYREDLFGEELSKDREAMAAFLDQACADKPALLLSANNISCVCNSEAMEIVQQTAEEEMVKYITAPYVLNLLLPFDFEEIEETVFAQMKNNAERGITSVLSLGAPDYFESLYIDALISFYNEELLSQRYFSSYFINRPLLPKTLIHQLMQMKTMCNEIGDFFSARLLLVLLDQSSCPLEFSQSALDTILADVADKGFDIYIRTAGAADLEKAYLAAEQVRSKGYKVMIAVESPQALPPELAQELMYSESILFVPAGGDSHETVPAAQITGCADRLGTIEVGKLADMAVFEADPYESLCGGLPSAKAVMTICNGVIVKQQEVNL